MIRISGNPLRGCKDGKRSPPVHSCGAVLCTSQQSWENRKPCTANQSQGEIPTTWKMAKIVTMLVTRNRRANALPAASSWCRSRAIRLHAPRPDAVEDAVPSPWRTDITAELARCHMTHSLQVKTIEHLLNLKQRKIFPHKMTSPV